MEQSRLDQAAKQVRAALQAADLVQYRESKKLFVYAWRRADDAERERYATRAARAEQASRTRHPARKR